MPADDSHGHRPGEPKRQKVLLTEETNAEDGTDISSLGTTDELDLLRHQEAELVAQLDGLPAAQGAPTSEAGAKRSRQKRGQIRYQLEEVRRRLGEISVCFFLGLPSELQTMIFQSCIGDPRAVDSVTAARDYLLQARDLMTVSKSWYRHVNAIPNLWTVSVFEHGAEEFFGPKDLIGMVHNSILRRNVSRAPAVKTFIYVGKDDDSTPDPHASYELFADMMQDMVTVSDHLTFYGSPAACLSSPWVYFLYRFNSDNLKLLRELVLINVNPPPALDGRCILSFVPLVERLVMHGVQTLADDANLIELNPDLSLENLTTLSISSTPPMPPYGVCRGWDNLIGRVPLPKLQCISVLGETFPRFSESLSFALAENSNAYDALREVRLGPGWDTPLEPVLDVLPEGVQLLVVDGLITEHYCSPKDGAKDDKKALLLAVGRLVEHIANGSISRTPPQISLIHCAIAASHIQKAVKIAKIAGPSTPTLDFKKCYVIAYRARDASYDWVQQLVNTSELDWKWHASSVQTRYYDWNAEPFGSWTDGEVTFDCEEREERYFRAEVGPSVWPENDDEYEDDDEIRHPKYDRAQLWALASAQDDIDEAGEAPEEDNNEADEALEGEDNDTQDLEAYGDHGSGSWLHSPSSSASHTYDFGASTQAFEGQDDFEDDDASNSVMSEPVPLLRLVHTRDPITKNFRTQFTDSPRTPYHWVKAGDIYCWVSDSEYETDSDSETGTITAEPNDPLEKGESDGESEGASSTDEEDTKGEEGPHGDHELPLPGTNEGEDVNDEGGHGSDASNELERKGEDDTALNHYIRLSPEEYVEIDDGGDNRDNQESETAAVEAAPHTD